MDVLAIARIHPTAKALALAAAAAFLFPSARAGEAPARLPVPAAAARRKARKQVKDIFRGAYAKRAKPDRRALARTLLEQALKGEDEPGVVYVLLSEARDIAAKAGDARTAVRAIDEMARLYAVDSIGMKTKALRTATRMDRAPEAASAAAEEYLKLVDESLASNSFSVAEAAARSAANAAEKAKNVPLAGEARATSREVQELKREYARTQEARATLHKDPRDPDANLAIGRYLCLLKGDWEKGLPMLLKGPDGPLKALAVGEVIGPADPAAQVRLAEGWRALAEKHGGRSKSQMFARARYWYEAALLRLKGLARVKAKTDLGATVIASATSKGWIDALSLVDLKRHRVAGTWKRHRGALVRTPRHKEAARVTIPVAREGSYELEVKFTRTAGSADVTVYVPAGSRRAMLLLSGWDGRWSGLTEINGRFADRNETTVRPGTLQNGRAYALSIKVSVRGQQAAIAVDLDGRPYIGWKGPQSALSIGGAWAMPKVGSLGLGVWNNSAVTFHSVKLKVTSGEAKLLDLGFPFDVQDEPHSFQGRAYCFFRMVVTWHEAEKLCRELGGHLVTIKSREENDFVVEVANGKGVWLGLTKKGGGPWRWLTGESVTFTNWRPGEGPGPWGQDYGGIGAGRSQWDDYLGRPGERLCFICEWEE